MLKILQGDWSVRTSMIVENANVTGPGPNYLGLILAFNSHILPPLHLTSHPYDDQMNDLKYVNRSLTPKIRMAS